MAIKQALTANRAAQLVARIEEYEGITSGMIEDLGITFEQWLKYSSVDEATQKKIEQYFISELDNIVKKG